MRVCLLVCVRMCELSEMFTKVFRVSARPRTCSLAGAVCNALRRASCGKKLKKFYFSQADGRKRVRALPRTQVFRTCTRAYGCVNARLSMLGVGMYLCSIQYVQHNDYTALSSTDKLRELAQPFVGGERTLDACETHILTPVAFLGSVRFGAQRHEARIQDAHLLVRVSCVSWMR